MQDNTRDTMVVLTALDLECRAVLARLTDVRAERHAMGTIFQVGRRPGHVGDVAVAITGAGNQGAAVIAERAIATFAPRALFFVGVAGALHDDLALGDVVIGTKIYAYHGGLDQANGFHARPQTWEAPHALDQLARHLEQHDRLSGQCDPRPDGSRPAVWFRPIAAGEVVLNSRDTTLAAQLNHHYNDAAAIEMESAGTAKAAQLNDQLPMLTVRGISDKADGNKRATDKAGHQPVAATAAAAVAMTLIDELLEGTVPRGNRSAGSATQSITAHGGSAFGVLSGDMHIYQGPAHAPQHLNPAGEPSWQPLAAPVTVHWRSDLLGQHTVFGSGVLEIHLMPVDGPSRLEMRQLARLPDTLVAAGRAERIFTATEQVVAHATDLVAVATSTADRTAGGVAVTRTVQRSSWSALPRDNLGAVLDLADLVDRITNALSFLTELDLPEPQRVAFALRVRPAGMVVEGRVRDLPRQQATGFRMIDTIQVIPDDSFSYRALRANPGDVAEELCARLIAAFRAGEP